MNQDNIDQLREQLRITSRFLSDADSAVEMLNKICDEQSAKIAEFEKLIRSLRSEYELWSEYSPMVERQIELLEQAAGLNDEVSTH